MSNYFVHETSVVDEGARIGKGTKIWHFSHVMQNAIIGENCILGQNVMIANNVILGNGIKVQNNVSIYDGVVVEDDAFIGPSVVFTNVKAPRSFVNRKDQFLRTSVGKGATIGANATIVCGVSIGEYAMIGAGALVTKDVKAYSLVVGSPAKHREWVSKCGNVLNFNVSEIAICSESSEKYKLVDNQLIELK